MEQGTLQPEVQQAPLLDYMGKWRRTKLGFLLLMGVILPIVALGMELAFHFSAEMIFDPIPNFAYVLLIAMVPLANGLLWFALVRNRPHRARLLAWLNAFAISISLFYTLFFLTFAPYAFILILFFGIGLLPLSPFFSLIYALAGRRWLRRMAEAEGLPPLPRMWKGVALGLAAILLVSLPDGLTQIGMGMAASESEKTRIAGLNLLRTVGDENIMLEYCYSNKRTAIGSLRRLINLASSLNNEKAQKIYYQVTGVAFHEQPRPETVGTRYRFRSDMADTGISKDLKLVNSSMEASVDADAAITYLEWTLIFKNKGNRTHEAITQIALPPGTVVSRLTLWIDGEEREAAFGERGRVSQAYNKVVRSMRDPALVTTAGKDLVQLRIFPVLPGEQEMKVRIGMTVPMVMNRPERALLSLPALRGQNFGVTPELQHQILIASKSTLEGGPLFKKLVRNGWKSSLQASLAVSELDRANTVITAYRNRGVQRVWSTDGKSGTDRIVVQQVQQYPVWQPKQVALVIDGSGALKNRRETLLQVLENFPKNIPARIFLAGEDRVEQLGIVEARTRLKNLEFVGGQDNASALAAAHKWSSSNPDSAILWLYGPQPVVPESTGPLLQFQGEVSHPVRLFTLELLPGVNRILENLEGIAPEKSAIASITGIPRMERIEKGLDELLNQWQVGGVYFVLKREISSADAEHGRSGPKTSEHLARLWALDEVNRMLESKTAQVADAVLLAQRYQLVTPVTGAVVLERQEQYDEAGLEPVAPGTVPGVPEPEEWALMLIALCLLIWQFCRYRRHRFGNRLVLSPALAA
ncbi:MAG: VIT domain-containing protein [Azovibrio sp.]